MFSQGYFLNLKYSVYEIDQQKQKCVSHNGINFLKVLTELYCLFIVCQQQWWAADQSGDQ